jgi:hypothetical protein
VPQKKKKKKTPSRHTYIHSFIHIHFLSLTPSCSCSPPPHATLFSWAISCSDFSRNTRRLWRSMRLVAVGFLPYVTLPCKYRAKKITAGDLFQIPPGVVSLYNSILGCYCAD